MKVEETLKKRKLNLYIKRLFDIVLSIIGLIILALPMLVVAILIKLDSEGPVFFKQVRVGRLGEKFEIFKFRTMVEEAPKLGAQLTVGEDPRITKLGRVLRQVKFDEIPQLINVFLGHMSFVGPRPEVPKYVDHYTPDQRKVLLVRPGITDLASIEYRSESEVLAQAENPEEVYLKEIMPHKLDLNLEYIKNIGIIYDIRLILKTIYVVIFD